MAEQSQKTPSILGDINPRPETREHRGAGGTGEEDETEEKTTSGASRHDAHRPGSRDVTDGVTGGLGPEVGGTRNYRQGSGATGGDIGNRPE